MQLTKQCTLCLGEFFLDQFQKQAGTKDGLKYECNKCSSYRASERYKTDPSILERNKRWQENNKGKHNEAAKRYYHSPTGRMSRNLNKAATRLFGEKRETLLHILGVTVPVLIEYLAKLLPSEWSVEDYGKKWCVGFLKTPTPEELATEEGVRAAFYWKNLRPIKKTLSNEDFCVKS